MFCSLSSVLAEGDYINFPGGHIQWGGMKVKLDENDGSAKTVNEQCPANYLTVSPKSLYFADEDKQKIDALFSKFFDSSTDWTLWKDRWIPALYDDETSGLKMAVTLYVRGLHYTAYVSGPNVTEVDMDDYAGSDIDLSHPVGPYAVNHVFGFEDPDCGSYNEVCDGSNGEKYVVFMFNAFDQDGNPPQNVVDNVFTFKDSEMKVEVWDHFFVSQGIGSRVDDEQLGKPDPIASIGPNGEMVITVPVEMVAYTTAAPTEREKRSLVDRAASYQIGWEVKLPQCGSNGRDKVAAGVFVMAAAVFSRLFV
jgi:hypothetical protein